LIKIKAPLRRWGIIFRELIVGGTLEETTGQPTLSRLVFVFLLFLMQHAQ
jgi:hypothetical protein